MVPKSSSGAYDTDDPARGQAPAPNITFPHMRRVVGGSSPGFSHLQSMYAHGGLHPVVEASALVGTTKGATKYIHCKAKGTISLRPAEWATSISTTMRFSGFAMQI